MDLKDVIGCHFDFTLLLVLRGGSSALTSPSSFTALLGTFKIFTQLQVEFTLNLTFIRHFRLWKQLNNNRRLLRLSPVGHAAVTALCCRRGGRLERLLEVGNDVVDVLSADGDADEVLGVIMSAFLCLSLNCGSLAYLGHAGADLLLVSELLVGCGPGVDG